MDEDLVRCRPCGYIMKASDLGDVCPACGLPRNVFEPYRERVSAKRLFVLNLDIHPISIHLSQTFVALIPLLIIFHYIFPDFNAVIIHSVINFSIFVFPFVLIMSIGSGIIDGITRFKTLRTPMLWSKIVFSSLILIISGIKFFTFTPGEYPLFIFLLSLASLACAIKLGLIGKKLINVILPGTYVPRKKRPIPTNKPKVAD